ncbi:MAG: hypothetical protein MZW92_40375 [Comamonadaceae bacterium]|nr:hypothetical protein [Comamonadaceae bacterium]
MAAGQAQEKVELKLTLPKPMFIGTPTNIKSANLEVVTGKSRGPFMVPAGTKLLSLKRPVDVERQAAGHRRARDDRRRREGRRRRLLRRTRPLRSSGCRSTWARSTRSTPSWRGTITARPASTGTSSFQVADDKDFLKGVHDGLQQRPRQLVRAWASGKDKEYIEVAEGRLFDPKGATGRYVRMYSNGNTVNDLNHYVEIEVYGTPAKMEAACRLAASPPSR